MKLTKANHTSQKLTKEQLKERGQLLKTPVGANEEGTFGVFSLPEDGPHEFEDPVAILIEESTDDAKVAVVDRASLIELLTGEEFGPYTRAHHNREKWSNKVTGSEP